MTTKRKQTTLGVDTAINGVVSDPNLCAAIPLDCVWTSINRSHMQVIQHDSTYW